MNGAAIRQAGIGALAGGVAALTAVWLTPPAGAAGAVIVLTVLVIAIVAIWLGPRAAAAAYLVALLVMGIGLQVGWSAREAPADLIRIAAFTLGSPVVIFLAIMGERRERAWRRSSRATAERQRSDDRIAAETARRELHDALEQVEEQRARLEQIAEAIPEPLIVYDADGSGSFGNRAALRVFGRSFFDRPIDEWGRAAEPRDEAGRPLTRDDWPPLRARREAFQRRLLVRLPMTNRDLLVDVEGTPLPDGGCVLLLRDVGKEVDERQRLSRFASFVAHELRNPLAVAKARIELGVREPPGSTRTANHAQRALESVDAAIGLLERLELFSHAEGGSLDARVEPFELHAAIDAGIERLRAGGSDREVRIRSIGEGPVNGDRSLTEQAITNLLTNADRYSEPEQPIEVEIDLREAPVLRVRDAGPGIPDEVAEVIFRNRVGSGRGLGLGLFLVNAAMQAQGGSVQLEERRPRAAFALRWPAGRRRSDDGTSPRDGE